MAARYLDPHGLREVSMGTMKSTRALLMRPHTGIVVGLLCLCWFAVPFQSQMAHVIIGALGILLSLVALLFVGRATDVWTARCERFNMVAFIILFALLINN